MKLTIVLLALPIAAQSFETPNPQRFWDLVRGMREAPIVRDDIDLTPRALLRDVVTPIGYQAPVTGDPVKDGCVVIRDPARGGDQVGILCPPGAVGSAVSSTGPLTMKPTATRAAMAMPVTADVTPNGVWAYATKLSLASTTPVYGIGRDVGGWNLTTCNDRPTPVTALDAGRVLAAFPELSALTSLQADDVLARKAASDPRSRRVRLLEMAGRIAGDGFLIGGATTDTSWALIAGYAAKGVTLLMPRAQQNAPNEKPHSQELLPPQLSLEPRQCKTYTVFSSLIRNAANLPRRDIPMPPVL